MFNIFGKKKTAKDFMDEAKETYGLPEPKTTPVMPKRAQPSPVHYKVGNDGNNNVVLQIGDGYSMTLTMNNSATRQLIRLLEAAMIETE